MPFKFFKLQFNLFYTLDWDPQVVLVVKRIQLPMQET